MSEMEDRINGILNDPKSMERIERLAHRLMGGEAGQSAAAEETVDTELLGRIASVMSDSGSKAGDDKSAFLKAISPYLAEKRRDKLAKAMRLAGMARLAGTVFGESGGKDDGD